jgi:GTP-binding protein Era
MAILNQSPKISSPKIVKKRVEIAKKPVDQKKQILRESGVVKDQEPDEIQPDLEKRGRFTNILPEHEYQILKKSKREKFIPPKVEEPQVASPKGSRLLRVSLFGNPNVGKSTLINRLLRQKASAVSPKAQTTRKHVLGVLTQENIQIVLSDTPGVLSVDKLTNISRRHRDEQEISDLVEEAVGPIHDSDMVVVMLDATKPLDEIEHLLSKLADRIDGEEKKIELVCVLNKSDLIDPADKLFEIRDELLDRSEGKLFTQIFAISAIKGDGVSELIEYLNYRAIPASWMYEPSPDSHSLLPHMTARDRILEVVREKLYRRLNKELPYQTSLQVADFELKQRENGDSDLCVQIDMNVNTTSQKKILLGCLQDIHRHSIRDLKNMYSNVKVYLSFEVYSADDVTQRKHERRQKTSKKQKKIHKKK